MAYMMVKNYKYRDVINIYGISNSGVGGLFALAIIGYIFLMGICVGDLPTIWTSMVFLGCLGCSIVLSLFICKMLNFIHRDKIKYGNIVLADEEIQERILSCSKQLRELQDTMHSTAYFSGDTRKVAESRIEDMRQTVNKLTRIHQELQEQKIIMNAALGTKDIKNVVLSDGKLVNRSLDKEIDKFGFNRSMNSSFRGVEDIMKKYRI